MNNAPRDLVLRHDAHQQRRGAGVTVAQLVEHHWHVLGTDRLIPEAKLSSPAEMNHHHPVEGGSLRHHLPQDDGEQGDAADHRAQQTQAHGGEELG